MFSTLRSVSPGKPMMSDANVMMPLAFKNFMPRRYCSGVATFFMILRTSGSPDSIPRNTPPQLLRAIRSHNSSSMMLQRRYEYQRNVNWLRIIMRRISLKRSAGTLNVSSMKTRFVTFERSWICRSSCSTWLISCGTHFPALTG